MQCILWKIIGEVSCWGTNFVLQFPINGNNAVHNFVAKIDGLVIVAKVMEKNKAAAVYDGIFLSSLLFSLLSLLPLLFLFFLLVAKLPFDASQDFVYGSILLCDTLLCVLPRISTNTIRTKGRGSGVAHAWRWATLGVDFSFFSLMLYCFCPFPPFRHHHGSLSVSGAMTWILAWMPFL